jgi:hypothetical protein
MKSPMPQVTVPEEMFRRLAERAADLNISVDDLVKLALERLTEAGSSAWWPPCVPTPSPGP